MQILALNPGSTSTKIAVYEQTEYVFKTTLRHDTNTINQFASVYEQYDFRKEAILNVLKEADIDIHSLAGVVGRGGMVKPIASGTYAINEAMLVDLKEAKRGQHASNLGAIIAKEIADPLGIPSFIVDPVAVDEMEDIARITGMPEIKRQSLFHALNQKAVGLKAAAYLKKPYAQCNLILAHLGGGISVGAHQQGRVIDVNNALDGDGPMSPERSGSVPLGPLYKMALSGDYTLAQMQKKNYGQGGLVAHLGTNDGYEIERRIKEGDEHARFIYDAMAYQIAKEIGSLGPVLKGKIDAVVLTGGLAHDTLLTDWIKERTEWMAPVLIFPGEDEMEALAFGALRVLRQEEQAKEY